MEPVSPGCLEVLTEIVVNQPALTKNKSTFNNCTNNKENCEPNNIFNRYEHASIGLNNFVFNLIPVENFSACSLQNNTSHIFDAFLSSKYLNNDPVDVICKLNIINLPPYVDSDKSLFLHVQRLEQHKQKNNYFDNCLFIHKAIFEFAKIPVGCKARLETLSIEECPVETIIMFTSSVNLPVAVGEFKQYLTKNRMVFNSEVPFHINKNTMCSLKFDGAKFVMLDSNTITKYTLIPEFCNKLVDSEKKDDVVVTNFCNIGNMEQEICETLKMVFELRGCENILIVGKFIFLYVLSNLTKKMLLLLFLFFFLYIIV